jgi:hypothetical protein
VILISVNGLLIKKSIDAIIFLCAFELTLTTMMIRLIILRVFTFWERKVVFGFIKRGYYKVLLE